MKIGLFGGTFDPIHNGHIQLARQAYEAYQLDRVDFIPSGNSYLKSGVTEAEKRYEMTKAAIEGFDYFQISSVELSRTGPSYTCDTIKDYREKYPLDELYFLLGEDSIRNLSKWRNYEEIISNCTLLVAGRKEFSDLSKEQARICTKDIIEHYIQAFHAKIEYFSYNESISSSELRTLLKKHNLTEKERYTLLTELPAAVYDYILEYSIYQ